MGQHQHINVHFKRRTIRTMRMDPPRDLMLINSQKSFRRRFFEPHLLSTEVKMAKWKLNQKKTPQLQMLKPFETSKSPAKKVQRSNNQDEVPSADG